MFASPELSNRQSYMPSRNEPISQVDIARALGLGQSTVSLALRDSELVSRKTRALVARKAKELGYIPDPKMGALTRYRLNSTSVREVPLVAWVTNFATKDDWKTEHNLKYYQGAKIRAAELGFSMFEVWLKDPDVTKSRIRDGLLSKGVRGLLLAPQESLDTELEFDFSGFAALSIGFTLKSPVLHLAGGCSIDAIRQVVRRLRKRGYKRIGLMMSESINARVDGAFFGGFVGLASADAQTSIPPLMSDVFDETVFERWFEEWRPDALIVWGGHASKAQDWLRGHGLKLGEDVALARLGMGEGKGELAGFDQQSELIGKVAMSTLSSYLCRFEYGVPEHPTQTLVDGVWIEGGSAPGVV